MLASAAKPRAMTKLKIASWNINSVRARADLVGRLLDEEQPDILCLQETKAMDVVFPADLFRSRGYVHHELNGQKMHHGVAILSRLPLRDSGRHDWQDNGEARHVGARLDCGIRLENVYIPRRRHPQSRPQSQVRAEARLHRALTRWSEKWRADFDRRDSTSPRSNATCGATGAG